MHKQLQIIKQEKQQDTQQCLKAHPNVQTVTTQQISPEFLKKRTQKTDRAFFFHP